MLLLSSTQEKKQQIMKCNGKQQQKYVEFQGFFEKSHCFLLKATQKQRVATMVFATKIPV